MEAEENYSSAIEMERSQRMEYQSKASKLRIAIIGERNSGKTKLINRILGQHVFQPKMTEKTDVIVRICHSDSIYVKFYSRDNELLQEKTYSDITELKRASKAITTGTTISGKRVYFIDVHLPFTNTKEIIVLYDTPPLEENDGVGENLMEDKVNILVIVSECQHCIDYIDHRNLQELLETQSKYKSQMFGILFVTTKWDALDSEDSDSDEEKPTKSDLEWEYIKQKVKEIYVQGNPDYVFRMSLRKNETGKIYSEEFNRFMRVLNEHVDCLEREISATSLQEPQSAVTYTGKPAYETLHSIFEMLISVLTLKEYDDLQDEISTSYPNYIETLQKRKNDLSKSDCAIVIAGDVSAGKTTLINQIIGRNIFTPQNTPSTATVCRIHHAEKQELKIYDKDGRSLLEQTVVDFKEKDPILHDFTKKNIDRSANLEKKYYVDIFLPVKSLTGNVILVDTPGIGTSKEMDDALMKFLPTAVSFIFVVDAANAGGVQNDRLVSILDAVTMHLDDMPCFDPLETIFLTNKWDSIEEEVDSDEDPDDESQSNIQDTWEEIKTGLKKHWPWVNDEKIFQVSLKEVQRGNVNQFTEQYKDFEKELEKTIDINKNKRIRLHKRFLEEFIKQTRFSILARFQTVKMEEEEQLKSADRLKKECIEDKDKLQKFVAGRISSLAKTLIDYLHSKKGKEDILSDLDLSILNQSIKRLQKVIKTLFFNGIRRWCEGKKVQKAVDDIDNRILTYVENYRKKLLEIESHVTGNIDLSCKIVHDDEINLGAVWWLLAPNMIAKASFANIEVYKLLGTGLIFVKTVDIIYEGCMKRISVEDLEDAFTISHGKRYNRIINHASHAVFQRMETVGKILNKRQRRSDTSIPKRDSYIALKEKLEKAQEEIDKL